MAELLISVSTAEQIKAAVAAGADALLINGLTIFGSNDAFLRSVIFDCRRQAVRVYFEIDSPKTDAESKTFARTIARIAMAGGDALVLQSPGAAMIARNVCPDMPLFAGADLSVTDLDYLEELRKLGFSRVTPAKELNRYQLEHLKKYGKMPLMVTVHGEMCMSYNGQCHAGMKCEEGCGDFCRAVFSFSGTGRRRSEYPLSLKDVCLAQQVRDLLSIGVDCLVVGKEILKSAADVTTVTTAYSRIVADERFPASGELRALSRTMTHGGSTDGFYENKIGPEMQGRPESAEYASLPVFDADELEEMPAESHRRRKVNFYLVAKKDQALVLAAEDSLGNRTMVTGSIPAGSYEGPRQNDSLRLRLSSVSDRQFTVNRAAVSLPEGMSVDPDEVERMKIKCLNRLEDKQVAPSEHTLGHYPVPASRDGFTSQPQLILSYRRFEQIDQSALAASPQYIYLPMQEILAGQELADKLLGCGIRLAAVLPPVITDHEVERLETDLRRLRGMDIRYAVVGSPAALAPAREAGFILRGDFGLNLRTSHDLLCAAEWGLDSASILFDRSFEQIRKLEKPLDTEILAYGRIPLMLSENCISRNHYGICDRCESQRSIVDRAGEVYPIMGEYGCRNLLLDAKKIYLADRMRDMERLGVRYLRLSFTTENRSECAEIIRSYYNRNTKPPLQRPWRGAYYQN